MLFAVAPTDVIFVMDMDTFAPWELLEWAMGQLEPVRESCLVINAFRRLAPRCPLPCPHPAVMLLTKLSYWHIAGCDEDLVGRYGGTDPLFRHKTSVMRSCTTIHAANLGDMPLLQVIKRNGGPRKTKANGNKKIGLVAAKINGTRPWATSVLRFSWYVAFSTVPASASVPAPTPVLAPAPTKATSGTPLLRRGAVSWWRRWITRRPRS